MNGLFIPEITTEMFRNGCLESIEALMAEGEIYDIDYSPWIPCRERLPEKNVWVLVTVEQNDNRYQEIMRRNVYTGEWTDNIDNYTNEITAWMPLPEPYQKGGK